jgi:hypothetical protein
VTTRTTYYATPPTTPLSLLTALTNARYLRCLRSRKHRPGERFTRPRPLPGGDAIRMPICPECGVPVTGKLVTWNGHL